MKVIDKLVPPFQRIKAEDEMNRDAGGMIRADREQWAADEICAWKT